MQSDLKTNEVSYGASVDLSYALENNFGLTSSLGFDSYSGKNYANQNALSTVFRGHFAASYDFLPKQVLNPFVYGGGGMMFFYPRIDNGPSLITGWSNPWNFYLVGGVGVDYFIDESWSLIVAGEGTYTFSDRMDGYKSGVDDSFLRVSVGVRYYLFDRSTVQRIVDAVRR
jgi:hypothetical protein